MMNDILIKVENVSKKFCRNLKRSMYYGVQDLGIELLGKSTKDGKNLRNDEFWAVNNVSFNLRRGECLGLIGQNGAGKTTLLKMLNGLIKPDRGQIMVRGKVGALIALGAGFNPILTGRENIYVNASVLGLKRREIDLKIDEIIEFSELHKFIDSPVQTYSSGMQVRLGFAVAANLDPDVLLLDEVLAVGDMAFRAKCYNILGNLRNNTAIVFVSHSMPMVSRLCDRVILMDSGSKALCGNPELAINHYFKKFNTKLKNFGKNLMPNETIRIISNDIEALEDGENKNRILYGNGIQLKIIVKCSIDIENLVCRLTFLNTDLTPVAVIDSNVSGYTIKLRKGENHLAVSVPNLFLGPSKYIIALTFTKKISFESIFWSPYIGELTVGGSFIPNAPYYIEGHWRVA